MRECSSVVISMNAAAPKQGAPAAVQISENSKNCLAPPCLGEALKRDTVVTIRFSWFLCEPDRFMPVSTEPNL